MNKSLRLICIFMISSVLTNVASASPYHSKTMAPRIYECPASGDGYHHYQRSGREFIHTRISDTRCITYNGIVYVCSDCGDRYVGRDNEITEHEYGQPLCISLGLPQ